MNRIAATIIPAIDLRDGKCVRLKAGRFDEETVFDEDPLRAARRILGDARMLHVVDLDGARTGSGENLSAVRRLIAGLDVGVQCGGGLRTAHDVETRFEAGAERVVLGSLAVEQPETVVRWMARFGAERIVIALDVRRESGGDWRVATRGWVHTTSLELEDAIAWYAARGQQRFLVTDIGRDGLLSGPNTALYSSLVKAFPGVTIQASGGVSEEADLDRLAEAGVNEVIVGRALLEGRFAAREAACQPSA